MMRHSQATLFLQSYALIRGKTYVEPVGGPAPGSVAYYLID